MSDLEVLQLTKIANYVLSVIQLGMGLWVLSFLRHPEVWAKDKDSLLARVVITSCAVVIVSFALWQCGLLM